MSKKFITVHEAAELLGVKPGTLYIWAEQDIIPHVHIGRLLKFDAEKLATFFESGDFVRKKQGTPVKEGGR